MPDNRDDDQNDDEPDQPAKYAHPRPTTLKTEKSLRLPQETADSRRVLPGTWRRRTRAPSTRRHANQRFYSQGGAAARFITRDSQWASDCRHATTFARAAGPNSSEIFWEARPPGPGDR